MVIWCKKAIDERRNGFGVPGDEITDLKTGDPGPLTILSSA
jgi:hypothetical protein